MTGAQRIKARLPRRKLRKSRGFCEKCGKREAKYVRWVRKSRKLPFMAIRKGKGHSLCPKCFKSVSDSVRVQQLISCGLEKAEEGGENG